jgi:protein-disulfide isomerase
MSDRRRRHLDLISTVAILATCLVVVWAIVVRMTGPEPPGVPDTPLRIAASPSKGSPDAPVVMLFHSDFECASCRRFSENVLPSLEKRHVARGELRIVFRHLPLDQIHRSALAAAVTAECAQPLARFWEAHDLLIANQADLSEARLLGVAIQVGLSAEQHRQCLNGPARDRVVSEANETRGLGIASRVPLLTEGLT